MTTLSAKWPVHYAQPRTWGIYRNDYIQHWCNTWRLKEAEHRQRLRDILNAPPARRKWWNPATW